MKVMEYVPRKILPIPKREVNAVLLCLFWIAFHERIWNKKFFLKVCCIFNYICVLGGRGGPVHGSARCPWRLEVSDPLEPECEPPGVRGKNQTHALCKRSPSSLSPELSLQHQVCEILSTTAFSSLLFFF